MNNSEKKFAQKLCALALTLPAAASVQAEDSWQFSARFDGWFADVNGETALGPDGGNDFDIKLEDVIGSLNFAMLGSFDARKGRWGFVADVFYAEIGDKKTNYREGTPGGSDIPTSAKTSIKFDIKAGALTSAGFYRVIEDGGMTLDVLAGFRYMKIDQKIDWSITGDLGGIELPVEKVL
jgi:hypothetical protein